MLKTVKKRRKFKKVTGRTDPQCIITDKKSIAIFSCSKTLLDYSLSFLKTLTIVKQLREM